MRTVITVIITSVSSSQKKRTLCTHNLLSNNYTDKFLECDRLRECKNEETDNAKRGNKIQISQRMEHFDWLITNQV